MSHAEAYGAGHLRRAPSGSAWGATFLIYVITVTVTVRSQDKRKSTPSTPHTHRRRLPAPISHRRQAEPAPSTWHQPVTLLHKACSRRRACRLAPCGAVRHWRATSAASFFVIRFGHELHSNAHVCSTMKDLQCAREIIIDPARLLKIAPLRQPVVQRGQLQSK